MTELQPAHISKASINKLLDHGAGDNWQRNRLLSDEQSKLLADAVRLMI